MISAPERSRPQFIGREAELARLLDAYAAAAAGQGSAAIISGEPGIGKSSLCLQLAAAVSEEGALVLTGHCYEEDLLSVPYLPFIEALRSYILTTGVDELHRQMGPGASEIVRLLPELQAGLESTSTAIATTRDDRWRFFSAIGNFFRTAAMRQPLIIVLEDLQDADTATLDLLSYLARNLAGSRILLILTFRNSEVGLEHPLSQTLAEVRRVPGAVHIRLKGFSVGEVQMAMAAFRPEIDTREAAHLHQKTLGNPLYVEEILRYEAEADESAPAGVRSTTFGAAEVMPPGLRDVLGGRFSHLDAGTRQVLAIASIIGRDFPLTLLTRVAGVVEDDLFEAIEQATQRAIIEESPALGEVAYRFKHTLIRQALYDDVLAPRRAEWHDAVAGALEDMYAGGTTHHAAEIGEHFARSGRQAGLGRAIPYFLIAAEQASAGYAYVEAIRLLEHALDLESKLIEPDPTSRCDVLLALCAAMPRAGQVRAVIGDIGPSAFALALAADDRHRAWRSAFLVLIAFAADDGLHVRQNIAEASGWLRRLDEFASSPEERIRTDIWLATQLAILKDYAAAWPRYSNALDRALAADRCDLLSGDLLWSLLPTLWAPVSEFEAWIDRTKEVLERLAAAESQNALFHALRALTLLVHGDRAGANQCVARLQDVAAKQPELNAFHTLTAEGMLAMLKGDLRRSFELGRRYEDIGRAMGREDYGRRFVFDHVIQPLVYLGQIEEATRYLDPSFDDPAYIAWEEELLLYASHRGEAAAETLLTRMLPDIDSPAIGATRAITLLRGLEAALALRRADYVEPLVDQLQSVSHLLLPSLSACLHSIGRLVGDGLVFAGRHSEAEDAYRKGLAVSEMAGFRPEVALCHLGLAVALAEDPGRAQIAGGHLEFALSELEAMEMAPALARARSLEAQLLHVSVKRPGYPAGLSEREVDVLRLLAAGKSNRQIADELVISLHTVIRHVSNVLVKSGSVNRTEAASFAHRNGIV